VKYTSSSVLIAATVVASGNIVTLQDSSIKGKGR
jgi:hypothetical protein